jgi:hypothetical protein
MRLLSLALVTGLMLSACGGGTPPPKDESEANGDDGGGGGATAATDDTTPAAPATSASAAPATPPPDTSADVKPPVDDVWNAAHQVSAADVSRTMRVASAKVQACFKTGLKRDKTIGGDVKIRFVIANAGPVKVWKDDGSSMSDGDVTQCIGNVIQKLKFPKQKSPGDAWGSYTIHLGK